MNPILPKRWSLRQTRGGSDLHTRLLRRSWHTTWGCGVNSVRVERVAQGVEHVRRGRVGFAVPGGVSAAFGDLRFGVGVVVYHRTVMVLAMNVKGTLRW